MRLWDFRVRAERLPSGLYRVSIEGSESGVRIVRDGFHPLWTLIRLIGSVPANAKGKP